MFASRSLVLAPLLAALLLMQPAAAADKDPAKEQAKRQQQMQRKFEQEKSQLVQQKDALENELTEVRKKSAEEATRATVLAKESAALRGVRDGLKAKLAESEAELAAARRELAEARAEGSRLQATLVREKAALASCGERNAEMHRIGVEVLGRYERKGCFNSVLQAEPFTGLGRVELENAVEDLRDRLDAQRFDTANAGATEKTR